MKTWMKYSLVGVIVVCMLMVLNEQNKGLMEFRTSDGLTGLYNPATTVGYYMVVETKEIRYLSPVQSRNLYNKWCKNH